MKQIVLFTVFMGAVACQPSANVTPVLPISEMVGAYKTNGFLDYRCLTLSASQMPVVTLQVTGSNKLTLTFSQAIPQANRQIFKDLTITQQSDQRYEFRQGNRVIGSLQMGRVFTDSGMETQGKLLQLSAPTLTFTGYRP